MSIYKVVLLGEPQAGKTTFIRKIQNSNFKVEYDPTPGVEVHSLKFETTYGLITLHVWDCAGQEKWAGLKHAYWLESHGAIAMFDLSSSISYRKTKARLEEFHQKQSQSPIVICGNKSEIQTIKPDKITLHTELGEKWNQTILCHNISVKSGTDLTLPFQTLMQQMTGLPDLFISPA